MSEEKTLLQIYPELEHHAHREEILALLANSDPQDDTGERPYGFNMVLLSPDTLAKMADSGYDPLVHEEAFELKKDLASALKKYSPVERRIIFRIAVQGMTIPAATRSNTSRSARHWQHWWHNTVLPDLRNSLRDYAPEKKKHFHAMKRKAAR